MENRNRMGKNKEGVIFPVAPNLSDMSGAYLEFIEEIKKRDSTSATNCCIECEFKYDLSLLAHRKRNSAKTGKGRLGSENYRPYVKRFERSISRYVRFFAKKYQVYEKICGLLA